MEAYRYLILLVYSLIAAVQDMRMRIVDLYVTNLFVITGIVCCIVCRRSVQDIAAALIPGVIILLVSVISEGSIGAGDGIFILALALYMSLRELAAAILLAFLLSALIALPFFVLGNLSKRKTGKISLPYVSVMLLPIIFICLGKVS